MEDYSFGEFDEEERKKKKIVYLWVTTFILAIVLIIILIIGLSGTKKTATIEELPEQIQQITETGGTACVTNQDCIDLYGASYLCKNGECYLASGTGSSSSKGGGDGSGGTGGGNGDENVNLRLTGFFAKFFKTTLTGNAVTSDETGDIYYNRGRVGLGTTNPQSALEVEGEYSPTHRESQIKISNPSPLNSVSTYIVQGTGGTGIATNYNFNYSLDNESLPSWDIYFSPISDEFSIIRMPAQSNPITISGPRLFKINGNGSVGIGTSNPTSILELSSSNPSLKITPSKAGDPNGLGSLYLSAGSSGTYLSRNGNPFTGIRDNSSLPAWYIGFDIYPPESSTCTSGRLRCNAFSVRSVNVTGSSIDRLYIDGNNGNIRIGGGNAGVWPAMLQITRPAGIYGLRIEGVDTNQAEIILKSGSGNAGANSRAVELVSSQGKFRVLGLTDDEVTPKDLLLADISTGEIIIDNLKGTGNAYVCVDAIGKLYRSATACA